VENKNTRRIGVLICSSRDAFFKELGVAFPILLRAMPALA